VKDLDEETVLRALGLPVEFGSTKNTHVVGGNVGYAHVHNQRKYRQYMNREGANRLLQN
jgi:hypothetical protein